MMTREETSTASKDALRKELTNVNERCNGKSWYIGSAGEAYTHELMSALIRKVTV